VLHSRATTIGILLNDPPLAMPTSRVPVGAERRHDCFMASFDALRATVAAQRLRPPIALLSFARAPASHTSCADPEPFASLAVTDARVNSRKNANPEISESAFDMLATSDPVGSLLRTTPRREFPTIPSARIPL
jgi:hypothetical protein